MVRSITCTLCNAEIEPKGTRVVDCPECGETYRLPFAVGKGGDNAPKTAGRPTEKEEQQAGWQLMKAVRPDALIVDTSQPRQALITPGLPDWLVFTEQEGFFFFEWKRPGGTLSEAQGGFRAACKKAGVRYEYGTREDLARVLGLEVE